MEVGSIEIRVRPVLNELAGVRHALDCWLERRGMSESPRAAFVLAAHEAVANAIQHSGAANLVSVRGTRGSAGVEIEISDDGRWKVPAEPSNDDRGRGLELIRSLFPDATISSGAFGITVRLGHSDT